LGLIARNVLATEAKRMRNAEEKGEDVSVGSAHEEVPMDTSEQVRKGGVLTMGHEVLAESDSVWTPRSVPNAAENIGRSDEVWPATTRGAAIPRHLREDRLARSEARAKRRKEDCEQLKRQLTSKEVECDDLSGKVISWGASLRARGGNAGDYVKSAGGSTRPRGWQSAKLRRDRVLGRTRSCVRAS
jgi:hypothetical protein